MPGDAVGSAGGGSGRQQDAAGAAAGGGPAVQVAVRFHDHLCHTLCLLLGNYNLYAGCTVTLLLSKWHGQLLQGSSAACGTSAGMLQSLLLAGLPTCVHLCFVVSQALCVAVHTKLLWVAAWTTRDSMT
jgi:hypothetical protein